MPGRGEDWFQQRIYRNSELRRKGVKLRPKTLPLPKPLARPTEEDAGFLKTCGVTWDPEPASQLHLDFGGHKDTD